MVDQNFSIVVPTFREKQNIFPLIEKIAALGFDERKFEVLLVDDNSNDGTEELVTGIQCTFPWLKLIIRQKPRHLSHAILEGIRAAQYSTVITMDADLSHPPEKIPELLAVLSEKPSGIVIGSRYVAGGSVDARWPLHRQLTSRLGALMGSFLVGVNIRDPLSGFMVIPKQLLRQAAELKPIGWKIGLEIMVKTNCKVVTEVPIHFADRERGNSKLNFTISLGYIWHVLCLIWFKFKRAFMG